MEAHTFLPKSFLLSVASLSSVPIDPRQIEVFRPGRDTHKPRPSGICREKGSWFIGAAFSSFFLNIFPKLGADVAGRPYRRSLPLEIFAFPSIKYHPLFGKLRS